MSTNTGFIDLMSFAKGQEIGNQQNWKDVINDINTRQAEQDMQIQQDKWDLYLPGLQDQAQGQLDARQAKREMASTMADWYKEAAGLEPTERSAFLAGKLNSHLRQLDPNSTTGAAQIHALSTFGLSQANDALQRGDRKGAENILAASGATWVNPITGMDAQTQKQNDWYAALNKRFPGMFMQRPDGQPVAVGEYDILAKRMRDAGVGYGGGYGAGSPSTSYGAGGSYTDMNDWKMPGTEVVPGYATGWDNISQTMTQTPPVASNAPAGAMPQWYTAPGVQPTLQPGERFGEFQQRMLDWDTQRRNWIEQNRRINSETQRKTILMDRPDLARLLQGREAFGATPFDQYWGVRR